MASREEQIEFLRAFREFEDKYPKFQVQIDGEYSSGFCYTDENNYVEDFDEDIIKYYYTRRCQCCGQETGECEKFCGKCKDGCNICGGEACGFCGYCKGEKVILCNKLYLNRKEDALTSCGMIHYAESPGCWERFKNPFKSSKAIDWSWHDSIIEQIRKDRGL